MFFVVEEKEKILGYCAVMTVLDEGDILNVSVTRDQTKQRYRQSPCGDMILKMADMELSHLFLEVREEQCGAASVRNSRI